MSAAVVAATRVAAAARAFAATLSEPQRSALQQERTFAAAARWSNLPQGYVDGGRIGLRTGTMSADQWDALDDLLAAATGSGPGSGHAALRGHLDADDWLRAHGGGDFYGRGEFYLAFLGEPADDGTWQLQFGGHHLALANTYRDGVLVGATPSFRGIEPFDRRDPGGRGAAAEQRKHEAFVALLASLRSDQLATAKLPGEHRDLLLGPGRDWRFPPAPEGIAGSELDGSQEARLLAAVGSFVADVEDDGAARILDRYARDLGSTHVGFAGTAGLGELGDYVRIDGPAVWIEYSMHPGWIVPGPHPHAVWRDKLADYGGLGR